MAKIKLNEINNIQMLNLLRSKSTELANRIPVVTQANISEVGQSILEYPSENNPFISALTNQVTKTMFFDKPWKSPLGVLKKGSLKFGASIQQVFVDIITGKDFEDNFQNDEVGSLIKAEKIDNVHTRYISLNVQLKYKTSISDDELELAFRDENGLATLTQRMLNVPRRSYDYDEYLLTKGLLHFGSYKTKICTEITDKASAEDFLELAMETCEDMKFLKTDYNNAGVYTHTLPENMVLIVTPKIKAKLNLRVLAGLFNIEYADIDARVITIDKFDDPDRQALLIDEDFVQIWDKKNKTSHFPNPDGLFYNVWLHRWGIFAQCDFVNAIDFRTKEKAPVTLNKKQQKEEIEKFFKGRFKGEQLTTIIGDLTEE